MYSAPGAYCVAGLALLAKQRVSVTTIVIVIVAGAIGTYLLVTGLADLT